MTKFILFNEKYNDKLWEEKKLLECKLDFITMINKKIIRCYNLNTFIWI